MSIAFLSAAYSAISEARRPGSGTTTSDAVMRVGLAARVQALGGDAAGDGVGHEVADGPPAATRRRIMRRGDVDARHVEEADPLGAPARPEMRSRIVVAAHVAARRDAELGEGEDGLGLAPLGQRVGHVAADDEGQLVLRALRHGAPAGYRPCTTARRVGVDARHARAARRPPRRAGTARRRCSTPGSSSTSLCGGVPTGTSTHAVEPELVAGLLRADEVADVRRVERPAEEADARHGLTGRGPARRPRPGTCTCTARAARSGRARAASASSCRSRRPCRTRRRR